MHVRREATLAIYPVDNMGVHQRLPVGLEQGCYLPGNLFAKRHQTPEHLFQPFFFNALDGQRHLARCA